MTAKIPEKYAVIQSHLMLFSHRTNISSGRKYQKFNEEVMVDSSPQDNSPPTPSTQNTIQPMTPSPKLFSLLATQIKTIHPQRHITPKTGEKCWVELSWDELLANHSIIRSLMELLMKCEWIGTKRWFRLEFAAAAIAVQ